MKSHRINNISVAKSFANYPEDIRNNLLHLRRLIFETANEAEIIEKIEETLKWGEPAYITHSGSTIRLGWRKSNPQHYAIYFHCRTRLVDTFRELYKDKFSFEGNRAIVFNNKDEIPTDELKHCILLSLTYHKIKHLPLPGAK